MIFSCYLATTTKPLKRNIKQYVGRRETPWLPLAMAIHEVSIICRSSLYKPSLVQIKHQNPTQRLHEILVFLSSYMTLKSWYTTTRGSYSLPKATHFDARHFFFNYVKLKWWKKFKSKWTANISNDYFSDLILFNFEILEIRVATNPDGFLELIV